MCTEIHINSARIVGRRDFRIFGHFLEHFHRQVYGGVFDPGNPLSDSLGLRMDVIDALRKIRIPVLRWPGGCFASAYHWKDGIGRDRKKVFDKAWRVEEPNTFGTDEFIELCRKIGAEPYLCTNAGTGTPEEMGEWVEYCNLQNKGQWAKKRIENGYEKPHAVPYWSIGNENWGAHEMGAKTAEEWGWFVAESAKMIKRTDPSVSLFAPSLPTLEWNEPLIKSAGKYIDWICIHKYWDRSNAEEAYETCMTYTMTIDKDINKIRHILGALGCPDHVKIAFDEWNLRSWYLPHIVELDNVQADVCARLRDKNDINSRYTVADAVFTACFLNSCLRNCDIVGMANLSPVVNTRGAIYTYDRGIVLRPVYHVYDMYVNQLEEVVVDSWINDKTGYFDVDNGNKVNRINNLDCIATCSPDGKNTAAAICNRNPDKDFEIRLHINGPEAFNSVKMLVLGAASKDAYNDVDRPSAVKIHQETVCMEGDGIKFSIPPHSVIVIRTQ